MTKTLLYVLFLSLFPIRLIIAQDVAKVEWQHVYGGAGTDLLLSGQPTSDMGYIMAGRTGSSDGDVTGNLGANDVWVVKLDSSGELEWQSTFGGSSSDEASSIIQTKDGGFILAGSTNSVNGDVTGNHGGYDAWVVKLNDQGGLEWQKAFGGSLGDNGRSIQETEDAGYILSGSSWSNDGDVSVNLGGSDIWVVKLDSVGGIIWQKSLGGTNHESSNAIRKTSDNGYIVVGNTESNDGNVSGNHGETDIWVVKLDSVGGILWQRTLGGSFEDWAISIEQTFDDGFILAGGSNSNDGDVSGFNGGTRDFWIVKLDNTGGLTWQNALGGSSYELCFSVRQTSDSGYIATGPSQSNDGDVSDNHGSNDVWVVKLDQSGNLIWQKAFGGSSTDRAVSIHQTAEGDYVVFGDTQSNDGDVSGKYEFTDVWVFKFSTEYSLIRGSIFCDLNSNNTWDSSENGIINKKVFNLTTGFHSYAKSPGCYLSIATDTGASTVAPEGLIYFVPNPTSHSAFFPELNQQVDSLNDFAMQPTGIFNDLCVTITPVGFYRPGFSCQYSIDYTNVGTTTLNPTVVFFPDSWLTFDSASLAPSSVAPDSVVWQLPALAPFQSGQITTYLTVDVNAGLGTGLSSWVRIEQLIGDANVGNNSETWDVITQGSYDPNDILVDQNRILFQNMSPVPPDLTYIIRFQNTGTDTAFTVRIENDVPEKVDLSTFKFEASSHPVSINYLPHTDRMEYLFENILLPDSNTNEPLSHGYIRYRIKPKSTLMVGDSVLNDARIYFDFNAPIETNTAVTVIETSTSISELESSTSMLSPNPTIGNVQISLPKPDQGQIQLFDATGKLIESSAFNGQNMNVDISHLPSGMYTVLVAGENSTWEEKVVKQ